MALQLLKDYGSGSSSEEEFEGFPAEAQVVSTFPLSSSATSTDCNDSDGSFTNEPVLKKRKLTKKERMKRSVAKGRRNTHRAKLTMCRCHRNCNDHVSHDEVTAVNHAFWILDLEGQKNWIRQQVTRREISRRSTNWFENDLRKNTSFLFHLPTSNGTQVEVCRKKFLNAIGYGEDCG